MSLFWELPVDPRNVFANWFIGHTDPALDVDNHVSRGKPWIKFENDAPPWGHVLGLYVRNEDNTAWESMLSSGPTGPQGLLGPIGLQGAQGEEGEQGPAIPGPKGDKGDTGQQGDPGPAGGPMGPPGYAGDEGDEGSRGPPGVPGLDGAAGAPGISGLPGPRGDDGDEGWPGIPGAQGPPGTVGYSCLVNKTADQSIPNVTSTVLTWNNEINDPQGMHSNSVNPTRLTVQAAVPHIIIASVQWAASSGGVYRQVYIRKNGSGAMNVTTLARLGASNTHNFQCIGYDPAPLIGDYYEAVVTQDSGGALAVQFVSTTEFTTSFGAVTPGGPIGPPAPPNGRLVGCSLTHSVNQSIPNSVGTVLAFNTETYDTDNLHDTVTNNSRITIATPGLYTFSAGFQWAQNATGFRQILIRKNGTTVICGSLLPSLASASVESSITGQDNCVAGDYYEVTAQQSSGGALNVESQAQFTPLFTAALISGGTGAQGVMGPQGMRGDEGDEGWIGPPGNQGVTGPTGVQGERGLPGTDGEDGADGQPIPGLPGVDGATGSQGLQGERGLPGFDGEDGADGYPLPGPTGEQGAAGTAGTAGAAGTQGERGMPGFDGEDGADGWSIPGVAGATGAAGSNGSAGAAGVDGSRGPPGMEVEGEEGRMGPPGPPGPARPTTIQVVIGDGVNVIPTGVVGYLEVAFSGTIMSVRMLGDASGSIVVDVWKDTYANAPPTVADTITASAKPTLSSAQKSEDATLTGWTRSFTAGDWFGFNVDSATTVKRVTLSLTVC